MTKADQYQVPNIYSLSAKLHDKKTFLKIDLSLAYINNQFTPMMQAKYVLVY